MRSRTTKSHITVADVGESTLPLGPLLSRTYLQSMARSRNGLIHFQDRGLLVHAQVLRHFLGSLRQAGQDVY